MPPASSIQIPPPSNWQDFERLCCDLWKRIWNDPNAQLNGRQGQPQAGVDISGCPAPEKLVGVQCKGKDNFSKRKLTVRELEGEVSNAKNFEPKLTEFIVATSGPKDVAIEEKARKITAEHEVTGFILRDRFRMG